MRGLPELRLSKEIDCTKCLCLSDPLIQSPWHPLLCLGFSEQALPVREMRKVLFTV